MHVASSRRRWRRRRAGGALFVAAVAVISLLTLGVRPAGDWVRPIFGFDSSLSSLDEPTHERALAMMRQAGSTWTRVGAYWPYIERVPDGGGKGRGGGEAEGGGRDFTLMDRSVRLARRHGQTVIGAVIGNAPAAAAGGHPWTGPRDPSAFAEFTRTVVARYKRDIRYWEVWNEPNGWFWKPTPDATAYARLLRETYLAIKAEDPSATVISGPVFSNDHRYLERLYRALAAYPDARANRHFFDVLGVHPYAGILAPDETTPGATSGQRDRTFGGLPRMKAIMEAHGEPEKHVIVTEVAWAVDDANWTRGVGRERQAEYLVRAYEMAERWPWLDAMLWYGFKNDRGSEAPWSLVEPDLTPRPSYHAYRRAARGW